MNTTADHVTAFEAAKKAETGFRKAVADATMSTRWDVKVGADDTADRLADEAAYATQTYEAALAALEAAQAYVNAARAAADAAHEVAAKKAN